MSISDAFSLCACECPCASLFARAYVRYPALHPGGGGGGGGGGGTRAWSVLSFGHTCVCACLRACLCIFVCFFEQSSPCKIDCETARVCTAKNSPFLCSLSVNISRVDMGRWLPKT